LTIVLFSLKYRVAVIFGLLNLGNGLSRAVDFLENEELQEGDVPLTEPSVSFLLKVINLVYGLHGG
jgi:hypothetical protein